MDQDLYKIIMLSVSLSALVILAISYWLIMHQDGTILTVISSVVGGTIGYFVKKKTTENKGDEKK